tara:strand:+ start:1035 stop:1259 length:225 start_codon:yes stop_codon:yes gene_type:complete
MLDPLLIPTVMSIAIQGLIGVISQIQHSRCSSIKIGLDGCECQRKVPEEQEPVNMPNNNNQPQQTEEVEAIPVE